jgi:hypothetical protein
MNNEQIQEYVYKNYKSYKDKTLIITEHANHFSIKRHIDEAPLILSKSIY